MDEKKGKFFYFELKYYFDVSGMEEVLKELKLTEDLDPFNDKLIKELLIRVGFPHKNLPSLFILPTNIPNMSRSTKLGIYNICFYLS